MGTKFELTAADDVTSVRVTRGKAPGEFQLRMVLGRPLRPEDFISGRVRVSFEGTVRGKRKLVVRNEETAQEEQHLIPTGQHIILVAESFDENEPEPDDPVSRR